MKLTEQQFLDGLTTDQASYFNARLISIRDEFQASYAASVASVSAAKDHLLVDKTAEFEAEKSAHAATKAVADTVPTITAERDALQTQVDAIPDLQEQIKTLTAEVERLTALVPPPVPDVFANADWTQFRQRILSDAAIQRDAIGNPTAWPLMVLYLSQISTTPSRGVDIAQLWSFLIVSTPITPDEAAGINTIANECGVPLAMNPDGSIGQ